MLKQRLSILSPIILSIVCISCLNAELSKNPCDEIKYQSTILHTELLKTIQYLNTCLSYWKHQKYHPLSYFLTKDPTKWFVGKNQQEELDDHITYILGEYNLQAEHLGKLDRAQQKLLSESDAIKKDVLLHELEDLIYEITQSACDTHNQIPTNLYAKAQAQALNNHGLPSHFIRNWLEYSGLSLAGLGALYCWYRYGTAIQAWAAHTKKSAAVYLKEYLKEPLKKMRDIFYNKEPKKEFVSQEMIKNNQEMLEQMIKSYYENKYYSLSGRVNSWQHATTPPSKEEIAHIARNTVVNREIPQELMKDYAIEAGTPVRNILSPNGSIGSLFLMQLHNGVNIGYDVVKETEEILKANRLNMQILITIPTLLIAGITSYLGYKIYKYYSKKTNHSLKQALFEIERVLSRSEGTLSAQDHGCIVYWAYVIKKSLYHMSGKQVIAFNEYCDAIGKITITKHEQIVLTRQLLSELYLES